VSEKKKPIPAQRYNAYMRHCFRNINRKRRAKAEEEHRKEQLMLDLLELQFPREQIAIELSLKNQKTVFGLGCLTVVSYVMKPSCLLRYQNRFDSEKLKCFRCGKEIKLGQEVTTRRVYPNPKLYHNECYESLFFDRGT
jgi:hypothetical protein